MHVRLKNPMVLGAAVCFIFLTSPARAQFVSDSWLTYNASTKAVVGYSLVVDEWGTAYEVGVHGFLYNDAAQDVVGDHVDANYGQAEVSNPDTAWATSTYWEFGTYGYSYDTLNPNDPDAWFANASTWSDFPGAYFAIPRSNIPGGLVAVAVQISPDKACTKTYGLHIDITYQLIDTNNLWWVQGVGELEVREVISQGTIRDLQGNFLAYYPGTSGPLATTDHFGQFHDNPVGACYDGTAATIQTDTTQTIYVSDSYLVRTNSFVFKNLLGSGQVTNGVDASCTSNSNSDCGLTP